jgi:hypothetical protein
MANSIFHNYLLTYYYSLNYLIELCSRFFSSWIKFNFLNSNLVSEGLVFLSGGLCRQFTKQPNYRKKIQFYPDKKKPLV